MFSRSHESGDAQNKQASTKDTDNNQCVHTTYYFILKLSEYQEWQATARQQSLQ
jgi:hypothetical protein